MNDRARPEVIDFNQGWSIVQRGITKLKKLLEEGTVPEEEFNSEEHSLLYTTVFNMCTQRRPHDYKLQLYARYKETIEEYIDNVVLPALRGKHGEFMLRELVKRWDNHKIMVRWLSHFFSYLDRYNYHGLPALNEVGFTCFREQVYLEMKINVKNAAITLIQREREGEQIDRGLLKDVVRIFVDPEIGIGSMDAYESDFERPMLRDTVAYYSRKAVSWMEEDSCSDYMVKAEACLKGEKERVGHYLHASSEQKLLKIVELVVEVLSQYENQLTEKEHSGCHALLRADKVEDLSRMYRLFRRIPNDLEAVAVCQLADRFRQHVTSEGTALVKQAEDAAINKKAGKLDTHGGHEQAFVKMVIELHDKYQNHVIVCFANHPLFRKALMEAFDVINKGIAGSTTAELLATFCDTLLGKGGSKKLRDEDIEATLDKVINTVACISDKDLFAEFYRKKLASRICFDKSAKDELESRVLQKLKEKCWGQLTSKMEGMVTDLNLAREDQTSFERYLNENSKSNPEFTVTALSTGLVTDLQILRCLLK